MVRAKFLILLLILSASFAGLFLWRSPTPVQAQGGSNPICDGGTCQPDPDSGTYGPTVAARPELPNARGFSSSIVPKAAPPGPKTTEAVALPGSESYNYTIPILRLPGRNGFDLNLTAYYSSRVWTRDFETGTITFNADRDFPSYGFRLGFGYLELDSATNAYVLTEADNSKRRLTYAGVNSYNSNDSSYINYNPSTKLLIYKNGTRVTYQDFPSQPGQLYRPIQIKDTNGNFITITYRTETNRDQHINTITDTLGRVVTFNYGADGSLTSITQGTKTHATFTWNTSYVLLYNFSPSLPVSNTSASGSTHKVLTGCTYGGNNTKYSFTYGDWGIVKKIERKSSTNAVRSSVAYNYPTSATQLSDHPTWTTETVFDGVNTLTNTYSVVKSGGVVSSYTVTSPGGTKTVTNLSAEGHVSSVEIKDAANTVLRRADYTWTTVGNPRITSITTTLSDTGQQSKVTFGYTSYGNVSSVSEYDYGLVLKRITTTTYLNTSSYTTNTIHILDRPTQVLVKDAASAIKARTDFAYDLTAPSSLSPAPVNHDTTNYGTGFLTRGNVTRITRYSDAAGGTGSFIRNFAYDVAGNLRTADLDCCTTKQWTYNSTTQYAYPVTTTSGPVGTQLTTQATYNFASGTVATSTDENGKQTSYTYDNMDRLSTVTLPNGVVLTTTYNDSAVQPSAIRSSTANSAVQETIVDGSGRVLQQQLRNGASPISTLTTSYNDVARTVSTSNPTGPSETALWTVTQLDYLGRATTVTPPGSSGSYQYAYSGNSVTVTDPAGKQRRNTTDALGRLVKVEEPGWGDGAPGTGTVTITRVYCCVPGTITVTVNGLTKSVTPYPSSTASVVASYLAGQFTFDPNSPVNAGVTNPSSNTSVINFTAKVATAATNYPLSATYTSSAMTATASGPTLTGGQDASGPDSASLGDPMTTTYTYDELDNLLAVSQAAMGPVGGLMLGGQARSYSYDSLSRLTSAVTPESGTVTTYYTTAAGGICSYDPSSVCRRVDARSITTTYSYDGLGRLGAVTYSDGTPAVTYTYGTSSASNNNGRLVSLADGGGTESYTYDLMGRITNVSKVISGVAYNLDYAYNNASQLTSLTYPSGRAVTQNYDVIGRPSTLVSGPTTYLAGLSYNAAGQPLSFNYGNGVAATFSYNQRLQLASLRYVNGSTDLLNLAYEYGTGQQQSNNNGQIRKIKYYTAPGVEDQAKSQNYEYDAWSRLKKAYTTNLTADNTWRLEWDYDRFGNRKNQNLTGGTTSITTPQLSISETTNRIITAGYAHDAAGNMTNDSLHTYTYDAENRIKTVDSTAATYTYSGALRVKKVQGGTTTVYVFSGTKVIAEYVNGALSKEYVYSGSTLLATHEGATLKYHHPDHLSTRVETDSAGAVARTFGQFPFGEAWYETGTTSKLKFTSYERDSESGLDYAMFRYDSSRLGRFMSPDPLGGRTTAPQTMNRYAYVGNDPVNLVDPLGLRGYCLGYFVVLTTTENGQVVSQQVLGFICLYHVDDDGPLTKMEKPAIDRDIARIAAEINRLLNDEECARFLQQVAQQAFLQGMGVNDPSGFNQADRDYFDSLGSPDMIVRDLAKSGLNDRTEVDFGEGVSARTQTRPGAPIDLGSDYLGLTPTRKALALIHESLHHIGRSPDDQALADAVGRGDGAGSPSERFNDELFRHCR